MAAEIGAPSGGLPSALPVRKDINFERTRKEAAAADKLEMENAISRGEYVLVSDVETGWMNILSRVKTRVMQIPYTCAMVVVGDTDMSSVQSKIKDVVRDALMELSADWRDTKEDEDS
jgi:phage terminase Nu1 subunit (DNA packaging protein)